MLALEESWVKLPQCHLPWPSPTHQKKKLNYSTLDSNGSCTQLDFQVPPSILWFIKPQVTWKALLLPSETCKTVCFPILTISKHPGGRMDTWGFHRQDAYVDFKGLLLACCFCLPSMNDIFQPQEHYFPLGIIHFLSLYFRWGWPTHKSDLGPSTYSTFWPLRLFQGWSCNPSQAKKNICPDCVLTEKQVLTFCWSCSDRVWK